LLPDLPINNINFITTMASNVLDNGQTNTLILFIACSDPTAPTDLQYALDHSLDGNTDASTTDFQQEEYKGIE
jgi:hypothetical protein